MNSSALFPLFVNYFSIETWWIQICSQFWTLLSKFCLELIFFKWTVKLWRYKFLVFPCKPIECANVPQCKGLIRTRSNMSRASVMPESVARPIESVPTNCQRKSTRDAMCSAHIFWSSPLLSFVWKPDLWRWVKIGRNRTFSYTGQFVQWAPVDGNWNSARFSTLHEYALAFGVTKLHFMMRHVFNVQDQIKLRRSEKFLWLEVEYSKCFLKKNWSF